MSMTTFRVINVHLNPFIQLISGQSLPEAEIYKYPVGPTRGLKKKYVKNSDAIFLYRLVRVFLTTMTGILAGEKMRSRTSVAVAETRQFLNSFVCVLYLLSLLYICC